MNKFFAGVFLPTNASELQRVGPRRFRQLVLGVGLYLLLVASSGTLLAQSEPAGDPTGVSGDYNGMVTTAGSYDAYTGNAKRDITDLVVPGSNGTYPLAFSRTSNSRTNAVPGDEPSFGDCGNWRHSYQWVMSLDSTTGYYTVAYPDGRVTVFQFNRPNAPAGTPYMRGPIGTSDQLEVVAGSTRRILHLADGGLVNFDPTDWTKIPKAPNPSTTHLTTYRANSIADAYGSITTLTYGIVATNASYLKKITEPGGRSINLNYTSVVYTSPGGLNYVWILLSNVQVNPANSPGTISQSVTYNYPTTAPVSVGGGVAYYMPLKSVSYDKETNIVGGGILQAIYDYSYGYDGLPLLLSCDDPHYSGAMTRILYDLNFAYASVWGALKSEMYFPQTGSGIQPYKVSTLWQNAPNTPTSATDTRGDEADSSHHPIARTFTYGEDNIPNTSSGVPTAAKPFQPTTVTDFQGNATHILYNTSGSGNGRGYVAQTIDPTGAVTQFVTEPYTGKVKSVTRRGTGSDPALTTSAVWAGKNGTDVATPYYLFKTTDERGQITNYYRNSTNGYIYEIDYPDNSKEKWEYQPFTAGASTYFKVLKYYNKLGALIQYNYGANGGSGRNDLLISVSRTYRDATVNNVAGANHTETTTLHYDSLDRVDQVTDQRGVSDKYSYNGRHQLTQVMHVADGKSVYYAYDNYGRPLSVTDELNHVTSTVYDDYGRPTSVTQPVNAGGIITRTTRYTYDRRDTGNVVIGEALSHTSGDFSYMILPSGRATQHIYNVNGWLKDSYSGQSTGNLANLYFTSCLCEADVPGGGYDAVGRLLKVTDAQGNTWRKTYDTFGRPWQTFDPLGHATTTSYYAGNHAYAGLVQSVALPGNNYTVTASSPIDATPATTYYTGYDAMGRSTVWVDSGNHQFASGLDAAGNVTSQSDGMPTTGSGAHPPAIYGYDQLGRKNAITHANGTYEQWTYDTSGNVHSFRNRRGKTQTYDVYDMRNRPTGYQWDDPATGGAGIAFDFAGRCLFYSNGFSRLDMTYDDSGGLLTEQQTIGGGTGGPVVQYTPNVDGGMEKVTYPSGDAAKWDYDYLNRIQNVKANLVGVGGIAQTYASYAYYADWLANRTTCAGIVTAYNHQNNNRINVAAQSYNGTAISYHSYGYYPNGQMSWLNKSAGGSNPLENNTGDAYYYYNDNELYVVNHEAQNVYNPAGFPSSGASADSWPLNPTNPVRGNQYGYDSAQNRQYDYESGVVSQPTFNNINCNTDLGYDNDGNTTDAAYGSQLFRYTYNAFDQLINVNPYNLPTVASFVYDPLGRLCKRTINGVVTNLYYAGDKLVEERDANNNKICIYLYGQDGERVCRFDANNAGTFYHYDGRGFVTHLTNLSHTVDEQYLYDAFGTPFIYDGAGSQYRGQTSGVANNRFIWAAGYEWYPEIGLYRCGARFYSPKFGRFMQPDPVGQDGGLNIYAYCGNDPINGSDPSGLTEPYTGTNDASWYGSSGNDIQGDRVVVTGSPVPVYVPMAPLSVIHPGDSPESHSSANSAASLNRLDWMKEPRVARPSRVVGPPGTVASLLPVYGSGRSSINAFQTGHPVQGTLYALAAASDVLLVKALITGVVKGAVVVGMKVAATEGVGEATTVIGRVKDLQKLEAGEQSLLDRLPDLGSPKANWYQNSGVLRQEINRGLPIRDASPGDMGGQFLNAERNLLRDKGWTFDPETSYWTSPNG